MTHAVMTPSRTVAPPSNVATSFIDVLREQQERYLEAIGAAAAPLRDERGHLPQIAASTTHMTRQFFDAQRAILARQATYDAQVAAALDSGELDAGGIDAEGLGTDLLDVGAWDSEKAIRQLAALLDTWWWALNAQGQQMIDHLHARTAIRRQVASIGSAAAASDRTSSTPGLSAGTALPARVLAVLDADQQTDLGVLLGRLMAELDSPPRPAAPAAAPSAAGPTRLPVVDGGSRLLAPPTGPVRMVSAPDVVAGSAPSIVLPLHEPAHQPARQAPPRHEAARADRSTELRIRDAAEPSSARADGASSAPGACLERLERLEHLDHANRPFWSDQDAEEPGIVARVVVPMLAATSALTALMAIVG